MGFSRASFFFFVDWAMRFSRASSASSFADRIRSEKRLREHRAGRRNSDESTGSSGESGGSGSGIGGGGSGGAGGFVSRTPGAVRRRPQVGAGGRSAGYGGGSPHVQEVDAYAADDFYGTSRSRQSWAGSRTSRGFGRAVRRDRLSGSFDEFDDPPQDPLPDSAKQQPGRASARR